MGRTGKMFASQHWGVAPDVMTLAKGLGSGLPIGAVVAKTRVMEKWTRGAHGNTYGGNPLCCAAALATLDLVEREYAANAAAVGAYFMERLRELQARHEVIGEVRGKGLMIGMELVTDRASRAPGPGAGATAVLHRAFHNGLILLSCGASTVRFMPPLMITKADVDEALSILEPSLVEAMEGTARRGRRGGEKRVRSDRVGGTAPSGSRGVESHESRASCFSRGRLRCRHPLSGGGPSG